MNALPLQENKENIGNTKKSAPSKPQKKYSKQYFEQKLASYQGDDPLHIWLKYIEWMHRQCEKGRIDESEYLDVIERCCYTLQDSPKYKNNQDYLRTWISYAAASNLGTEIFLHLQKMKIGTTLSLFYAAYACVLETEGDYEEAYRILELGLKMKAQPVSDLKKHQREFNKRLIARVKELKLQAQQSSQQQKPVKETKYIPGYDKAAIYQGDEEFSFEELRAKLPRYQLKPRMYEDTMELLEDPMFDDSMITMKQPLQQRKKIVFETKYANTPAKPLASPTIHTKRAEQEIGAMFSAPFTTTYHTDVIPTGNELDVSAVLLNPETPVRKRKFVIPSDDTLEIQAKQSGLQERSSQIVPEKPKEKIQIFSDENEEPVQKEPNRNRKPLQPISVPPREESTRPPEEDIDMLDDPVDGTTNQVAKISIYGDENQQFVDKIEPISPEPVQQKQPQRSSFKQRQFIQQRHPTIRQSMPGQIRAPAQRPYVPRQSLSAVHIQRSQKTPEKPSIDYSFLVPVLQQKIKELIGQTKQIPPMNNKLVTLCASIVEQGLNGRDVNFVNCTSQEPPNYQMLQQLFQSRGEILIEIAGKSFIAVCFLGKGESSLGVFGVQDVKSGNGKYAMKIQQPPCTWEYYIIKQIQQRANPKMVSKFVNAHTIYRFKNESILMLQHSESSLQNVINFYSKTTKRTMEELICIFYTIELLKMLETLFECKIIHCNIKPENILILHENDGTLWENWTREGANGWETKGLRLIDFGSSIDLTLFPEDVVFVGDANGVKCIPMLSGKPWKYEIDTFGVCNTIHCMLFGKDMEIVCVDGKYRPKSSFKRYWQTQLWTKLFDTLLNTKNVPLKELRGEFETYLANNPRKANSLKNMLLQQNNKLFNATSK